MVLDHDLSPDNDRGDVGTPGPTPGPLSTEPLPRVAVRVKVRSCVLAATVVDPEGKVIPTHTQDLVLRLPPAATPDEDRRLLREAGRRAVTG